MPVTTNQPEPLLPETVLIHSPQGIGKTTLSATESAFFPPDGKVTDKRRPHITLHDMIWLKCDTDAITGFAELGYVIPPENVIDLSKVTPEEIVSCLNEAYKMAFDRAIKMQKNGIKEPITVYDTLGVIDALIVADASQRIERDFEEESNKKKSDNNFAVWRRVLNVHTPHFARMRTIPGRKRFLCHQTVKGEVVKSKDSDQNEVNKKKITAQGFTEGAVAAALTGKTWEFYHQQCSLVLGLEKVSKTDLVTGKKDEHRVVRVRGKSDLITKTRYLCLNDTEPADWRVLNKKILEAKK